MLCTFIWPLYCLKPCQTRVALHVKGCVARPEKMNESPCHFGKECTKAFSFSFTCFVRKVLIANLLWTINLSHLKSMPSLAELVQVWQVRPVYRTSNKHSMRTYINWRTGMYVGTRLVILVKWRCPILLREGQLFWNQIFSCSTAFDCWDI